MSCCVMFILMLSMKKAAMTIYMLYRCGSICSENMGTMSLLVRHGKTSTLRIYSIDRKILTLIKLPLLKIYYASNVLDSLLTLFAYIIKQMNL